MCVCFKSLTGRMPLLASDRNHSPTLKLDSGGKKGRGVNLLACVPL